MTEEQLSTPAEPHYLTIQQALRQLIDETDADAAFLATPSAQNAGGSVSITAWYPPIEQSAPLMTRWIHRAIIHALDSGHTTLSVGPWRPTPAQPKRLYQLIVTSIFHGDGVAQDALALLMPTTTTDSQVISLLEGYARTILGDLASQSMIPAQSSPILSRSAEITERGFHVVLHQIHTPLSAANFALEALVMSYADQWDTKDERLIRTMQLGLCEALNILRSASRLQIADDGSATPILSAVSLKRAIARARDLFPEARSRIYVDVHDDLLRVWADELWLAQVLTNLLDNAVKYSLPRTRIKVAAQTNGADRVRIAVHSIGGDFPADQQRNSARDALDAPFPSQTSSGLGLSITRHLITGMGGDIQIESDNHGATEVVLTLPVAFT